MELIRQAPEGRLLLVQSYGESGFKVSGTHYAGPILILKDEVRPWPVAAGEELSLKSLEPVIEAAGEIELLIIGCGATARPAPVTLREALRAKGIGVETMDSGAACRTYNVLAGEGRRVGAALVVV